MDKETFNLIVGTFYLIATIFVVAMLFFVYLEDGRRRHGKETFKTRIKERIRKNIPVNAEEILIYRKSYGLSEAVVRNLLRDLYVDLSIDEEGSACVESLKLTVEQLEKEEPYSDFKDHESHALRKISKIVRISPNESDPYLMDILNPILSEGLRLRAEEKAMKRKTNWSMGIAIVSLILSFFMFAQQVGNNTTCHQESFQEQPPSKPEG